MFRNYMHIYTVDQFWPIFDLRWPGRLKITLLLSSWGETGYKTCIISYDFWNLIFDLSWPDLDLTLTWNHPCDAKIYCIRFAAHYQYGLWSKTAQKHVSRGPITTMHIIDLSWPDLWPDPWPASPWWSLKTFVCSPNIISEEMKLMACFAGLL